jgi:predicted anti-sigma-YlaC factor YlaD
MATGVSRLDCRKALHHLSDLLEDRLDVEAKGQVYDHMIRCKTCRMALDLAKETLATYFTPDADPERLSRTSLN